MIATWTAGLEFRIVIATAPTSRLVCLLGALALAACGGSTTAPSPQGLGFSGRLPPLPSRLTSIDFFRFDPAITYPGAGSFVRHLIDDYGLGAFKSYVASATFDDAAGVTQARFMTAYGRTLASVWEEWRARIR